MDKGTRRLGRELLFLRKHIMPPESKNTVKKDTKFEERAVDVQAYERQGGVVLLIVGDFLIWESSMPEWEHWALWGINRK